MTPTTATAPRAPSAAATAAGLLALAVVAAPAAGSARRASATSRPCSPRSVAATSPPRSPASRAPRREGASGPTVDLVVVPSAYGDSAKDRAENLALAQERTDQLDAACDAAVTGAPHTGCTATLAVLLNRADALDPANAAALAATRRTDGIYVLGGDQGIAMQVLAALPGGGRHHRGRAAAGRGPRRHERGRGRASRASMINGYTGVARRRRRPAARARPWCGGATTPTSSAASSSGRRGRSSTSTSTSAAASAAPCRPSPPPTSGSAAPARSASASTTPPGVRVTGDTVAVRPVRRELGRRGRPRDAGRDPPLGRQPGHALGPPGADPPDDRRHDLRPGDPGASAAQGRRARRARRRGVAGTGIPLAGRRHGVPRRRRARQRRHRRRRHRGPRGRRLEDGPARRARRRLRLAAAGRTPTAQAVKKAGWTGPSPRSSHGSKGWPGKALAGATAVVLVGDDPVALASSMADPAFRDAVTAAVRTTPVVLADGTMTAVLGARWSAKANAPRPTSTPRGRGRRRLPRRRRRVAARARPGAGDARAAPHRRLPLGSALRRRRPRAPSSSPSASPPARPSCWPRRAPRSSGASVVVADGREASYWTGANGALGAERRRARRLRRRRGAAPLTRPVVHAARRVTATLARRPRRATVEVWGPPIPTTTDDVRADAPDEPAAATLSRSEEAEMAQQRVVVGVDGSPLSMAAVTRAAQVASARGLLPARAARVRPRPADARLR